MSAVSVGAAELLELEQTGAGRFRSRHNLDNGRGMNFGGQPLLQGLAAARRTAPGWPAHSISSLYLRGGIVAEPVDYAVETLRDGRRFAARRVLASQRGKPVFDMLCSFQDPEDGPRHQTSAAPPSPPPEGLEPLAAFVRRNADRIAPELFDLYVLPFPIELRLIDPEAVLFAQETRPVRDYWFRMPSAAAVADPLDHECLLACASDYWFAGAAAAMHYPPGAGGAIAVVTLNHAIWFHAPARADGWLLYQTDSPWAGEGRGLVRGSIYDEAGRLVATTAQEISIRRMDAARGAG